MLTESEQCVLRAFRGYLMPPHKMLCFSGPEYEKHKKALEVLADKRLLMREKFKGAYSLTDAGFETMQLCG